MDQGIYATSVSLLYEQLPLIVVMIQHIRTFKAKEADDAALEKLMMEELEEYEELMQENEDKPSGLETSHLTISAIADHKSGITH